MSGWDRIWEKRLRLFWKEALIYWSYAARSGLSALLILFFIAGTYYYTRTLQKLPESFPYWRVTSPVMAVVIGFSPIRTFLKEADRVFLMPAEYALTGYFRRSLAYSFLNQAVLVLAALLLVWPLYVHGAGKEAMPLIAAAAAFLAAKIVSLLSRKHELRLVHGPHRAAAACIRWLGSAVFSFMIFVHPWGLSGAVLLMWTLISWLTIRLLPKYFIHWDALIDREQKQVSRHYFVYNWFADVPELPRRAKPRRLFAGAARMLTFEQKNALLYLTIKTWVRSDLFGIAVRITLAAGVLLTVFHNDTVRFAVYAGSMLMSGASLTALNQIHRHNVWLELYPIHSYVRARAIAFVAFAVLLGQNVLIGGLLILFVTFKTWAAASVLIGIVWSWYFCFISLQRKVKKETM